MRRMIEPRTAGAPAQRLTSGRRPYSRPPGELRAGPSCAGLPLGPRPSSGPSVSSVASAPETSPTISPPAMTRIRSERPRISSSSTDTRRTALPESRSSTSRRWMNSIAPMSTPAGRLADDEHRGAAVDLPGKDELLLVASGKGRDPQAGLRRPDVVGRHLPLAVGADGPARRGARRC